MYRNFTVERSDRLAVLTLARPAQRNAFSVALMRELTAFARSCEGMRDLDCVIVTGGPEYFSAGADLRDPERFDPGERSFLEQRDIAAAGFRLCKAWEEMPQITIAAIEGYAIGGGLAFALACDWRVMSDAAFVSLPEIGLGFPLTWGTIPRIVNLAGPALAKRIVILCERMDADDASRCGLVDYTAPAGTTLDRARAIAERVSALPQGSVRMSKETINTIAGLHTAIGSHASGDQFTLAAQSAESIAARARFTRR